MSETLKTLIFAVCCLLFGLGCFLVSYSLDQNLNKECEEKGGVRVKSGSYSSTCIKAQKIE